MKNITVSFSILIMLSVSVANADAFQAQARQYTNPVPVVFALSEPTQRVDTLPSIYHIQETNPARFAKFMQDAYEGDHKAQEALSRCARGDCELILNMISAMEGDIKAQERLDAYAHTNIVSLLADLIESLGVSDWLAMVLSIVTIMLCGTLLAIKLAHEANLVILERLKLEREAFDAMIQKPEPCCCLCTDFYHDAENS